MKDKSMNLFKQVANIIFFFISIILSVYLFVHFGKNLWEKLIWGTTAVGIELFKNYTLIVVKGQLRHKQWGSFIAYSIAYLGVTIVSIIASLGFSLLTIQGQSFASSIDNMSLNNYMNDIASLDLEINAKIKQQEMMPEGYATASNRLSEGISKLREEKANLLLKINELNNQPVEVAGMDMFSLLGSLMFKRTGEEVLFILMLIASISIEVCLALTSGDVERKMIIPQDTRIFKYIEALMSTDASRLLPDHKIGPAIDLPIPECRKYRRMLADMQYAGKPLIEMGKGGTKANFTKENIIKIVRFQLNTMSMN